MTLNLLVESDNDKIALSFETILDESVPVDKAVQVNYKNEYWGEPEFHSNWHIRGDSKLLKKFQNAVVLIELNLFSATFGFKFQFLEGNEVRVYTEGGSLVFAYKLQSNLPIIGINVLKLEGSVATISEYGFRFIEDY